MTEKTVTSPLKDGREITLLFTWDAEDQLWVCKATTEFLDDFKEIYEQH